MEGSKWIQKPCTWQLEGTPGTGIYPIKPWKRSWFLDQNREFPKLKVDRYQLPLGPSYSITAHGSQGQTLAAAIVDLLIGRGVNIIASYVAFTRVRTRKDLLEGGMGFCGSADNPDNKSLPPRSSLGGGWCPRAR